MGATTAFLTTSSHWPSLFFRTESPPVRGTLMLQRAAQARAFLDGRDYCIPDDFKTLAVTVFSHRVAASSRHASLQKKSETTEAVLRDIVDSVRVPL